MLSSTPACLAGLQEDHVVHMVKSKQPQRQQEQGGNRFASRLAERRAARPAFSALRGSSVPFLAAIYIIFPL